MTYSHNTKRMSLVFSFILFTLSFFPLFFAYAQNVIVPTGITYDCANQNFNRAEGDCRFEDLIFAVQKVVNYARNLALGISVIVLVVAGFRYMISGDKPAERAKANQMLWKVVLGIFFILAAWLIVKLITNALIPGINTFMQ